MKHLTSLRNWSSALVTFLLAHLLLGQSASLDPAFELSTGCQGAGVHIGVEDVELQPDGKIIVGGAFDSYNGVARSRIVRLNSDGSVDLSFDPGTGFTGQSFTGYVFVVALQPDGKILVGGDFHFANGVPRHNIARLNADGSVDLSFDPGSGASSVVMALAVRPNGKIVVGGDFLTYDGTDRHYIAQVNADGSLDPSFDPGTAFPTIGSSEVYDLALQPDGNVIVGGAFTEYNGTPVQHICRLDSTATLDTTFTAFAGSAVWSVERLTDGRILAGGRFATMNGVARSGIARLHNDGSLDTGFDPGTGFSGAVDKVFDMGLAPDGRLAVCGRFTGYDGVPRSRIARIRSNGDLDPTFDPATGFNDPQGLGVTAVQVQADGKVLVGGYYTTYQGGPAPGLVRLNGDVCMVGTPCDDGIANTGPDALNEACICTGPLHFDERPIAGGDYHTLAICSSHTVQAAGKNEWGQLGNGNFINSPDPVFTLFSGDPVAVAAGWEHSMALCTDSLVRTWGYNVHGQLGDGSTSNRAVPAVIPSLTGVVAIDCGGNVSLALRKDGSVWTWGDGMFGQLGNGSNADGLVPAPISGLSDVVAISGGGYFSIALKADGTVWSWGHNVYGQLGNGTFTNSNVPLQVPGLANIVAISAGFGHAFALEGDGTLWSWGYNISGALADGSTSNSSTPIHVTALVDVARIICGGYHTLALRNDGTLWAWGSNPVGQVGNGSAGDQHLPVPIGTVPSVVFVAGGEAHSLALSSDSTVWSWGQNIFGQLGNGTLVNGLSPAPITGLCGPPPICGPSQLTTTADPVASCGAHGLTFDGTSIIAATDVPGANRYQFRFTNVAGQPAYVRNIAFPTRSFVLDHWYTRPLKAGRSYNVVVRASLDGGVTWCPFGASCTVTMSWTPFAAMFDERATAASEADPSAITLYPNPASGSDVWIQFNATFENETLADAIVSDAMGRIVRSTAVVARDGYVAPLTIADLPSGTYIVQVRCSDQRWSAPLVVVR